VTLDVDSGQLGLTKKRAMSPQQIKEAQIQVKQRVLECKKDILR